MSNNPEQKEQTKKDMILNYLINLINTKKIKVNEIMPSEYFLMEKFGISRITAINAYKKLENIGAVYSKNKQGRYVAEHFYGMIKPFSELLDSDHSTIKKSREVKEPKWFEEFNIKFIDGWNSYHKEYFKENDEKFMVAKHYISKKYDLPEMETSSSFSLTNFFIENRPVMKNMNYKLRYEKVNEWGFEYLVVVYVWGYDEKGICLSSRYIVHPKYFEFYHQEKSLI